MDVKRAFYKYHKVMDILTDKIITDIRDGVKRYIIPDDVYLQFRVVKETVMMLKIGEIQEWPIRKTSSLRSVATRLRNSSNWRLRIIIDKKRETVSIFRSA